MTMAEYLKSMRTTTQEEVDALTTAHDADDPTAEERYESRSHHQESQVR